MSVLNQLNTIESLSNVNISNPTNNDILQYNSILKTWQNQTLSTGSSTLASLTDVTLSSPTNNQVLMYDGTKWINNNSPTITYGTYTPSTFDRVNCNTSSQLSHYVRVENNVTVYYFIAVSPTGNWSFKINIPIT